MGSDKWWHSDVSAEGSSEADHRASSRWLSQKWEIKDTLARTHTHIHTHRQTHTPTLQLLTNTEKGAKAVAGGQVEKNTRKRRDRSQYQSTVTQALMSKILMPFYDCWKKKGLLCSAQCVPIQVAKTFSMFACTATFGKVNVLRSYSQSGIAM